MEEKKFLTKEQFIRGTHLKTETINIPEFGENYYIKVTELTAYDRDQFENWMLKNKDNRDYQNFRARLASMTIVDEQGNRLFSQDDIEQLGKVSASILDRICDIAQKLSGMKKEDVDSITKNS